MTEERVTKSILRWLVNHSYEIICFDFPQSGTGRFLHPNGTTSKNKDSINPDIVAIKGNICLFFENKDRFYLPDFNKQNALITNNNYTVAISELLASYPIEKIYYGIGMPLVKYGMKAKQKSVLVDFVVTVSEAQSVDILHQGEGVEM